MPSEVILPRVDMDMATGKISKWLVSSGAAVSKGQPLFEIETDKATMEIEAETDGTIRDLVDASATDIPVGSIVAWIDAKDEPPVSPAPAAQAADKTPAAQPGIARRPVGAPAQVSSSNHPSAGERICATPLARRLAREHGIDLGGLRGSGPRGRIQAADVTGLTKATVMNAAELSLHDGPVAVLEDDIRTTPLEGRPRSTPAIARSKTDSIKLLRDGEGPPLLLVHGFGAEANSWRPFLQGLALNRPVFGLDLPGHGATPLGSVTSFEHLVDAVEMMLSGGGISEATDVIGHSLGAGVMAVVAARGMVDIRSLLLLAPAGLGPEINGGFIHGHLAATSEASLMPWMRELVADPRAITPAFVRSTLRAREGTDRVAAQRQIADATFPDGTQSFSIRDALARLKVPTRIVFGAADKIIPARQAVGLPPLTALHIVPNVGHMPQLEARDIVAAIAAQMSGHESVGAKTR